MSNLDITALGGTVSGGPSTNILGNQQLVQSVTLNNGEHPLARLVGPRR